MTAAKERNFNMSSPTKPNTRVSRRFVLAGGAATGALIAGCAPWRKMTGWIGGKPKAKPALAAKPDQGARLKQVLDELSVSWLKQKPPPSRQPKGSEGSHEGAKTRSWSGCSVTFFRSGRPLCYGLAP
jgi:hypothetical protein